MQRIARRRSIDTHRKGQEYRKELTKGEAEKVLALIASLSEVFPGTSSENRVHFRALRCVASRLLISDP